MGYSTDKYTEQGGSRTVIGGEIEVLPGATIKADEGSTIEGFGGTYTLPAATASLLGGVKVGNDLDVTADGTLSNPHTFPFIDLNEVEWDASASVFTYHGTVLTNGIFRQSNTSRVLNADGQWAIEAGMLAFVDYTLGSGCIAAFALPINPHDLSENIGVMYRLESSDTWSCYTLPGALTRRQNKSEK